MLFNPGRATIWLSILSSLLPGNVLASHEAPDPPHDYSRAISLVNNINLQNDNNGGCLRYQEKLTQAWRDLWGFNHAGLEAARDIEEMQAEPTQSDKKAYNEWLRKTQPFRALFGPVSSFTQLKERAEQVRSNYDKLNKAGMIRSPPEFAKFYIRCNDDWFQYKPSTFKDPRTPGDHQFTIGSPKHPNEPYPQGAFFLPGMPNARSLYWEQGLKPTDEHPVCKSGEFYVTIPNLNLLIWCEAAFRLPEWTMLDVEMKTDDGTSIDEYRNAGTRLWMEALFEYTIELKGQNQIDLARTWADSVKIAKKNPSGAVNSPDAYIRFAAAMYMKRSYWGTGKAKSEPEEEPFDVQAASSNTKPDDDKSEAGKGKGKGKAIADKCKDVAKRCGKALKPGSSKKGQSSKNPHGRRMPMVPPQVKPQSGSAPLEQEPTCEECGYKPLNANVKHGRSDQGTDHDGEATDEDHIRRNDPELKQTTVSQGHKNKQCEERKTECEKYQKCMAQKIALGTKNPRTSPICELRLKPGPDCHDCDFKQRAEQKQEAAPEPTPEQPEQTCPDEYRQRCTAYADCEARQDPDKVDKVGSCDAYFVDPIEFNCHDCET